MKETFDWAEILGKPSYSLRNNFLTFFFADAIIFSRVMADVFCVKIPEKSIPGGLTQ